MEVPALESHIDQLYQAPLEEFTTRRNALAKTLSGAGAKRVKKLPKPTVVPWAANQLYWKARAAYDRLLKSGERLRRAQLGALEGRAADLRAAADAHRQALSEAVKEAEQLAATSGSRPALDALMRTLETLSLMRDAPASPGRLTEALQPAGFEALAGVPVRLTASAEASAGAASVTRTPKPETTDGRKGAAAWPKPAATTGSAHLRRVRLPPGVPKTDPRKEAEAHKREAAAAKRHEADIKKGEAAVARATSAATLAREAVARADREVQSAAAELKRLRAHRTWHPGI